jgi:hypothetical protein
LLSPKDRRVVKLKNLKIMDNLNVENIKDNAIQRIEDIDKLSKEKKPNIIDFALKTTKEEIDNHGNLKSKNRIQYKNRYGFGDRLSEECTTVIWIRDQYKFR